MVTHDMIRVGLEDHPLTATAALVWSGDLPRPLQQILFDAADGIASPDPARASSTDAKFSRAREEPRPFSSGPEGIAPVLEAYAKLSWKKHRPVAAQSKDNKVSAALSWVR
jgi:hypothetical protein